MTGNRTDLLILGGGLAGGLCALALKARRPDLRVTIMERDAALGGNHVWSFFDSDVDAAARDWVEPLIERHWDSNEVRFPDHRRLLGDGYNSITSERFDRVLRETLGPDAIIQGNAADVRPDKVRTEAGDWIEANAVLDMRGFDDRPDGIACGWQKFVGQLVEVLGGHGVERPVIMDADVDQSDGYRFVYLLPFDSTRIFIEDTYYQDDPVLDRDLLAGRIAAYADAKGWKDARVVHEEEGVLPVVTGGDFDSFWPSNSAVARAGVRGGFFHPLTSYSLPSAVDFASWLADQMPLDGEALERKVRARAAAHWRQAWFDRMLARMLFKAADPADRYRILQRFYRLPAGLIARFYAGRSTMADRLRILAGKPPVSIPRAIRAILEKS
ncbi:lycopene beta-cyclase CrtY [Sphingomicrobium flavum]|uniref:lycopene beta-cyclase CrtY n=1 Tax=Sphingomicrobium flavum TaxID=1229164 RepID=UPI0021AD6D27|nr:lycopene beta-cyclase CrtY [Sphingomicrobium flavum]